MCVPCLRDGQEHGQIRQTSLSQAHAEAGRQGRVRGFGERLAYSPRFKLLPIVGTDTSVALCPKNKTRWGGRHLRVRLLPIVSCECGLQNPNYLPSLLSRPD